MGYLQNGEVTTEEKIYVIENVRKPLLGRPAITALKLLSRIDSVVEQEESLIKQFHSVFKGLGKLEGKYNVYHQIAARITQSCLQ